MRRPKTVVFGLITTLGLLALLEGGSRLVRHVEYPPDPLMTREAPRWPERRQYDSLLFWTLRPNPEDRILDLRFTIGSSFLMATDMYP